MKMLKQLAWAPKSLLLRSARNYGITPQFLHPLDAQVLLDEFPKSTKRTKTIATIGYLSIDSDLNLKNPRLLVSSLTKASILLDSIFHMVTMLSISDKWLESKKLLNQGHSSMFLCFLIQKDLKSEQEIWLITLQLSSQQDNISN